MTVSKYIGTEWMTKLNSVMDLLASTMEHTSIVLMLVYDIRHIWGKLDYDSFKELRIKITTRLR